MEILPLLYQDEYLVAINKPSGLLVHRSEIDRHETRFAMQLLRDQIGQRVYPLHRLDKPTSGVLVFGLHADIARTLGEQFSQQRIQKRYLCVVRGVAPDSGHIDHPLTEELDRSERRSRPDKGPQAACTDFRRLATIELPVTIERYPQSRYSLVLCQPHSGRKHQIRRHMKHISHPIIGDAKHGKGIHNRYFKEALNAGRLLLHAGELQCDHPVHGTPLTFTAPVDATWHQLLARFGWLPALPSGWHLPDASPLALSSSLLLQD